MTEPITKEELRAAAEAYWNQGLSIVLMTVLEDGKKDALHTWKQWETRRQTREEFDALPWLKAERFAVVCGVQGINSLYFTPIDTDDPDFDQNLLRVTQTDRTPKGGHHFVYWSRVNARGKKLHDLKIELLGKGNLCLMYPSKDYVRVNDNLPTEIDDIREVFESLAEKLGGHAKPRLENNRVRFCCREALARDNHIDHLMRLAIASEYKRAGYSNEDIVQLFKAQDDYDHDKCLVQVESADPSKAARYETIKEYGYCYPECQENCIETKRTQPKTNKKTKKVMKDSGQVTSGCFEAVYVNDKPQFLLKNSEDFRIVESVEVNNEEFFPKDVRHIPYEPYGYFIGSVPTMEELFKKVRNEFQSFVDVESIWKDVLAACVLLTYHQEKLQTLPYIFLYGDNESGKSTVLQVLKFLCYRPMYGVTIPSADLYGYLEDSDSIGTILEDEVQGINKDTDKIKIYKAGYKQGAVVPRTLLTQNDRIIKYYHVFCFKSAASEQIPQVKGFRERFIEIPMVEGYPSKEWADVTKEDLERLRDLRNMLLKWRMLCRDWQLPEVQLSMKGRVKELWKPLLQITHGLTVYGGLFKFVEDQKNERLSTRQNTLEGHIVKVVASLYNLFLKEHEEKQGCEGIPFADIWRELGYDLDAKLDDKKPHVMDTSEFFQVTKNKVGYRLREVLSGKSKTIREKHPEGDDVIVKAYAFEPEKLGRIVKKYGYELVTKLPSEPSSEGAQALKTMERVHEKEARTPPKLDKLSNLVTDGKKPKPVTETEEEAARRIGLIPCQECKARGKDLFFGNDADLAAHMRAYHESQDYGS